MLARGEKSDAKVTKKQRTQKKAEDFLLSSACNFFPTSFVGCHYLLGWPFVNFRLTFNRFLFLWAKIVFLPIRSKHSGHYFSILTLLANTAWAVEWPVSGVRHWRNHKRKRAIFLSENRPLHSITICRIVLGIHHLTAIAWHLALIPPRCVCRSWLVPWQS